MADTCKWMADNEICCNDKCPMCVDFCPVPYDPGVCRYEDRDGAEGGGEEWKKNTKQSTTSATAK